MMQRRVVIIGGCALLGAAALGYALERPGGYGVTIDYRQLIGPPPVPGSAQAVAERAGIVAAAAGIGGPRWQQASRQVHPSGPEVEAEIDCAAGVQASLAPVTSRMIGNAVADLSRAVEAPKKAFHRDRPYVGQADTRTCDPRTLGSLGGSTGGVLSYSYPSGHAAQGRLVADILGAAIPDRAAALAAWGDRLGDNRVICRVHWPSDVVAGRKLGDAMFTALRANPAFRADMAIARGELAKAPVATGCASR